MKHSIKHMIREEDGGAAPVATGPGSAPIEPAVDILGAPAAPVVPKEEASGKVLEGWLAGVDNEYASDSSMQNVKSIEDLAKGYVHAQRMIGKDRVVMPSEHATDAERREFLHKLGLPKTQDEYTVKPGEESKLSEDFANNFVARAYEQGIMPAQAQDMLNWYEEQVVAEEGLQVTQLQQTLTETVDSLKEEYGQAYETKIGLANKVLESNMDPETIEKMRDSGLLSNREFIRTMVKIGEGFVQEGTFTGDPVSNGKLSPSEATRKIGEIQSDQNHPYHTKNHPNHEVAVKEMQELFEYVS